MDLSDGNQDQVSKILVNNIEKLMKRREYRLKSKSKIREKERDYEIKNKERIKERKKKYNRINKEIISTKKREFYLKNREAIIDRQRLYNIQKKKEKNLNYLPPLFRTKYLFSWKDKDSTRKYFDFVTPLLHINDLSDWYRISKTQIIQTGGLFFSVFSFLLAFFIL